MQKGTATLQDALCVLKAGGNIFFLKKPFVLEVAPKTGVPNPVPRGAGVPPKCFEKAGGLRQIRLALQIIITFQPQLPLQCWSSSLSGSSFPGYF